MHRRQSIGNLVLLAGCCVFAGCGNDEIMPPENPPELVLDDFPACVVTINGEILSDETFSFKSGDSLKIEVALTYREGVDPDLVLPCMVHIIKDADRLWEDVAHWGTNLVDDPVDVPENTLIWEAEWTPEVEPGSYGLYVCTELRPEDFNARSPPMKAVAYYIIEVLPK
jgi:hypothetical protein